MVQFLLEYLAYSDRPYMSVLSVGRLDGILFRTGTDGGLTVSLVVSLDRCLVLSVCRSFRHDRTGPTSLPSQSLVS